MVARNVSQNPKKKVRLLSYSFIIEINIANQESLTDAAYFQRQTVALPALHFRAHPKKD